MAPRVSPKRETFGAGGDGAVAHEGSFGLTILSIYLLLLFATGVTDISYMLTSPHNTY